MAEIDVTRIAGNIGAMNSLNALSNINKQLSVHQTRLATGKRINTAADDPAGLTIATKMQSRSEGLKVALGNIGDAKNLLAVAESGLGRINDILIQMRNKAEAAASDTMGTEERNAIKTQLSAFAAQVDDIVNQTKWNSTTLLKIENGGPSTFRFQTGADSGDATTMNRVSGVDAQTLGVASVSGSSSLGTIDFTGTNPLSAASAGNATFAGMSELASGDYSLRITIGTVDGSASDSYAQLIGPNGDPVYVDADGTDGAVRDTKLTFSYDDDGAAKVLDFGNGLRATLDTGLTAGDKAAVSVSYTKAGAYSISATTASDFASYLDTVQTALSTVNGKMAEIGALTGRLSFKEDQVSAAQINVEAAYNRVMNANMAEEQVNASKYQILQQTATAMLAQANAAPQFLLSLFR